MPSNFRVIGALATVLVFAGCAATPGNVQPAEKSNVTAANRACTGSRIPTTNCASEVRAYSSSDLYSTGSSPAQDGLQNVSSSLTIHH
jgi:hypothetical protein